MQLKRVRRIVKWAFVAYLIYFLLASLLPFLSHPKVSEEIANFEPLSVYSDTQSEERVAAVSTSTDALLWRLRMIESAQDEIVLSTFEFAADESGKDVLSALLAAANRNVQVRIIWDGLTSLPHLADSAYFNALTSHPNVQLRAYAPVNLLKPWQIQTCLHDKYLIIDRQSFLLGGRNTLDLFLGEAGRRTNIDQEVLVYNPTLIPAADSGMMQLVDYFESVWALDESVPRPGRSCKSVTAAIAELTARYETLKATYPAAFQPIDWQAETLPCNNITLLSNPIAAANKAPELWHQLSRVLATGNTVLLETPYIIGDRAMMNDIATLAQNGTEINFLTNSVANGANIWGCAEYLNNKDRILATGANVFEFLGDNSLHTKTILVDDRLSIVGSYNFDMRSTYIDTELMLVVDSTELTSQLASQMDTQLSTSRQALPDGSYLEGDAYQDRSVPWHKTILYTIIRIFMPLFRHLT